MDPGWGWVIESYYNNRVKSIYTSVYNSLLLDKKRTFVVCEIIFFRMWYEEQSNEIKLNFKKLVENKQIEFVGGGYVQNDEATTRYNEMLLNIRLGNQFILKEFNVKPIVGWQLDPFGHSSSMAYIYSILNYKYVVLDRIDFQLLQEKINKVNLEFIYKPFDNLLNKQILYHITPHHYGNPICNFCVTEYIITELQKTNDYLKPICDEFIKEFQSVYKNSNTSNIMHLFGGDFKYKLSQYSYQAMELVFNYINSNNYKINDQPVKIFYSTPTKYFESLENDDIKTNKLKLYIEKKHDLFPLASDKYCLWTGFFSTRPYLKGIIETTSNVLFSASVIFSKFLTINKYYKNNLYKLKWVSTLNLHHDAITGTSNNWVSSDFINKSKDNVNDTLKNMAEGFNQVNNIKIDKICIANHKVNFGCDFSFDVNQNEKNIYLSIINPMISGKILIVIEIKNVENEIEVKNVDNDFYCIDNSQFGYEKKCFLSFFYEFNSSDLIFPIVLNLLIEPSKISKQLENEKMILIQNELLVNLLEFDPKNISFNLIMKNYQNYSFSLTHALYYGYSRGQQSDIRDHQSNNDGLYIFAPTKYEPEEMKFDISNSYYYIGKISISIILRFENLSFMIITIFKYPFFFKIDSIIDPNTSANNKNYVLHLQSNLNNTINEINKNEFWTDANSMKMIRRIKDYNYHNVSNYQIYEKVANNFYPISKVISIREKKIKDYNENSYEGLSINDKIISIYVDRPESGGALKNGEIMLLIQRNSISDDNKGIGCANYENESNKIYFRVSHFLMFGNSIFLNDFNGLLTQKFMKNYLQSSIFIGQSTNRILLINEFKNNFILSEFIQTFFDIISEKLIIVQFYFDYDYYFTNDYNVNGGIVTILFNNLMVKSIRFDGNGILCEEGGKNFLNNINEKHFRLERNEFLFVYLDLI